MSKREYPLYPLGMDRVVEALSEDHDLPALDLCAGASAFDSWKMLPDVDASSKLREQLKAAHRYGDPRGEPGLREAIAALLTREHGIEIPSSRVVVTDGASSALTAALLTLVQPGDEVIMPRYYFPPYALLTHAVGARCRFAAVDESFGVTADSIRELITPNTAAILLNSPSNPFGHVLPRPELERILNLGIPVVSDEVYGALSTDVFTSVLQLSGDHVVIGSVSKAYAAAGLRVGYAIVPESLMEAYTTVRVSLSICTSLPAQALAETLISHHDVLVPAHRQYLEKNRKIFIRNCNLHGMRLVSPPRHGFFGVVDTSPYVFDTTESFAIDLARQMNLAVAPGSDFAEQDPKFLRINYSAGASSLEAGFSRLRAYFDFADRASSRRAGLRENCG